MKTPGVSGEEIKYEQEMYYGPPAGRMYKGRLVITSRRLLFYAEFDHGASWLFDPYPCMQLHSGEVLEIRKENIDAIETEQFLLHSWCRFILKDGSRHTLSNGGFLIKKCLKALQALKNAEYEK